MKEEGKSTPLFSEFEPVSAAIWEKNILNDLKAESSEDVLIPNYEGIKIKPFYSKQDLEGLPYLKTYPGAFPYLRGNQKKTRSWINIQKITVTHDHNEAIYKAADCLTKGADGVRFYFEWPNDLNIELLLRKIDVTKYPVYFTIRHKPHRFFKAYIDALKTANINAENIKGGIIGFKDDPIRETSEKNTERLSSITEMAKNSPNFYTLIINGSRFGNLGCSATQEVAFSLSKAVFMIDEITENGTNIETALKNVQINLTTDTDYFLAIAKFRAIRLLWAMIVDAYNADHSIAAYLRIQACSSLWQHSIYDPYVNLLRNTTKAMAAIIGGCNAIEMEPHDSLFKEPQEFSERLSRNIPILLKKEAYLDKVSDPSAGSYYIENLTNEIANSAWNLFKVIEEQGGYKNAYISGLINKEIDKVSEKKLRNTANGKEVIVGVNKFPKRSDNLGVEPDQLVKSINHHKIRAAYPFEILRGFCRFFNETRGFRPKAHIIIVGHGKEEDKNANFAKDFFNNIGFDITFQYHDKLAASFDDILQEHATAIVVASPENEYAFWAETIGKTMQRHSENPVILLAGNPKEMKDTFEQNGFRGFLYKHGDAMQTLAMLYEKLS